MRGATAGLQASAPASEGGSQQLGRLLQLVHPSLELPELPPGRTLPGGRVIEQMGDLVQRESGALAEHNHTHPLDGAVAVPALATGSTGRGNEADPVVVPQRRGRHSRSGRGLSDAQQVFDRKPRLDLKSTSSCRIAATRRREDSQVERIDLVCTIGLADISRRADLLKSLVPQVLARRREERTVTVDLPSTAEEELRGFIAEESRCCPFFSFRLDRIAEGVRLTVETPPGGEAMLGVLGAAFDHDGSAPLGQDEQADAPLGGTLVQARSRIKKGTRPSRGSRPGR
jgi:hypothetical protein